MVAVLAVIGEIHSLLALGVARDNRAIGVQNRFFEELGRLLSPDTLAGFIDRVHQGHDIHPTKSAAEVAGSRGIGDALGAQGVEINLVVPPQFEVFEPLTACQDVEGDVQDVVRLVIGEMHLEQVKIVVDVADQAGPTGQEEHGADAAGAESLDPIAQLVVNIACGHHGYGPLRLRRIDQSFQNSPSALLELLIACFAFFSDSSTHSKASLSWNSEDVLLPLLFQKTRGLSRLFSDFHIGIINHACFGSRRIPRLLDARRIVRRSGRTPSRPVCRSDRRTHSRRVQGRTMSNGGASCRSGFLARHMPPGVGQESPTYMPSRFGKVRFFAAVEDRECEPRSRVSRLFERLHARRENAIAA